MKKWFNVWLIGMFLATIMAVPIGCGGGKITEKKGTVGTNPAPKGHDAAVNNQIKQAGSGEAPVGGTK